MNRGPPTREHDSHRSYARARRVGAAGLFWPLVLPLAAAVLSIGALSLVYRQWRDDLFERIEEQERQALVQVVSMARHAVEPILGELRSGSLDREAALYSARTLVRTMTYLDAQGRNYVFMSSYDGTMLVQPFEPEKELTSQWDLRDADGLYIIRELVKAAQAHPDGAFVRYRYYLPDLHADQEKLSYVVGLPELGCYIGTGRYMQRAEHERVSRAAVIGLAWLLLSFLVPVVVSVFVVSARNRSLLAEMKTRERAEEELRKSAAKYRSIFENAVEGMYQTLPDGRFLSANPALAKMVGFDSPEEMLDGTHAASDYYADPAERLELSRTILDKGSVKSYLTRFKRRDGSLFWASLSVRAVRDEEGKLRYFEGTIEDVTERRQAEEMSRQSEEKFTQIFMTTPDCVAITRLSDGLIVDVNLGFEEITGWGRKEAVGRTSGDINFWVDPSARAAMAADLTAGRDVLHRGFEFRRKDGSVRSGVFSARPVRLSGEQHLIFVLQDLTELRFAEQERERLQAQLLQAQKMESVGQLAGGVAHDFNNMLGVILGRAEMALEQLEAGQPLYDDLEEIRKAAQRSADLTRQLLAFARKQTIAPKVLDLNETISGMLQMLRRLIGEDIELRWTPGEGLRHVKIDPAQLNQILANLCVNARDAISGVGTIAIETREVTAGSGGAPPGEHVKLTVSDNGIGMGEEVLAHLFEPFFTTKALGKGTGLGLATIYGIVEQHGGSISAESRPGGGSTFTILFPAARGEASEGHTEEGGKVWRARGETVLLVEDEVSILGMGMAMLRRLGCTPLGASTATEAIRLAREHPVRLLITDVIMPEMNGRQLAARIQEERPGIPCLFISGYPADVIANRGILDSGVELVHKPFTIKEMAAKLKDLLDPA